MAADLTPGRELDARVCRLVWPEGVKDFDGDDWFPPVSHAPMWAMNALEALAGREPPWQFDIEYRTSTGWQVCLYHPESGLLNWSAGMGDTLPLAVCRAIIAALS